MDSLAPSAGNDLALGVEFYGEAAAVEVCDGGAELGAPAVRRVLVGAGVRDGPLHGLDDQLRRRTCRGRRCRG